jgi:hypothetical protein
LLRDANDSFALHFIGQDFADLASFVPIAAIAVPVMIGPAITAIGNQTSEGSRPRPPDHCSVAVSAASPARFPRPIDAAVEAVDGRDKGYILTILNIDSFIRDPVNFFRLGKFLRIWRTSGIGQS